jgi:hypothetical protein
MQRNTHWSADMSIDGQFSNSMLSVPFVQAARPLTQQGDQTASARDLAAVGFISLIGLLAAFLLLQAFPVSPWIATSVAQLS